jgi:hypothetical protein
VAGVNRTSFAERVFLLLVVACASVTSSPARAELRAGAAKVDITHEGPANGRMYARALVLDDGKSRFALIALDVVAIGEIGYVTNEFFPNVRGRLEKELGIAPANVLANASHCHGIPCPDVAERTVQAVKQAAESLVPVKVGVGVGREERVSENRRLKLKSGRTADVRHAYSLPPDEEVVGAGPIDPEIGVLRIDRASGGTLAIVYNFACHPIQGVPGGVNTADVTGFSSQVIEDNLGDPKHGEAIALFVQGCGGDINPSFYKDVDHVRSAEPLGNMLGLSTLKAIRAIEPGEDSRLAVINETLAVPRSDLAPRIVALEVERERLLGSLTGTSLNLKTFLSLATKYNLASEFPSYYSHRYLHEHSLGRDELSTLDADNRAKMKQYIQHIHTMEQLTRLQTNLALLKRHQAEMLEAGSRTIDAEVVGLRVGPFVLVTFPGELVVEIGLGLKSRSPHQPTFVAGYSNGYLYYAPTAEQLENAGGAQEDSDCLLAPEWQKIFEDKALDVLKRL